MSRRTRSAPTFTSARLDPGNPDGAIPRRVLGRTLVISLVVHVGGTFGLLVLALTTFDPIAGPPIVVHFIATAPPPPRLAPRREPRDSPEDRPKPPPIRTDRMTALLPPVQIPMPEPTRRRPDPPMPAEATLLPVRAPGSDLLPAVHDLAPPTPRAAAGLAPIGARPLLPSGSGEAPELEFLVPGQARRRGPGGGLAGTGDGLPPIDGLSGSPSAGRRDAPTGGRGGLGTEETFGGTGLAATLGLRYGVNLVDASRLGQRSSDGTRYSLLVPMLSEAFRAVRLRGSWRGPAGQPIESAQIDAGGIAIRYRDGTVHVIVPTRDGLVALYVSAGRQGSTERSKVDEADRALGALRHLSGRERQS